MFFMLHFIKEAVSIALSFIITADFTFKGHFPPSFLIKINCQLASLDTKQVFFSHLPCEFATALWFTWAVKAKSLLGLKGTL